MPQPLVPGLHELLVTTGAGAALGARTDLRAEFANVDPADQPHVLARHIYELALRALEERTQPESRLELLNDLVMQLEAPQAQVSAPPRQLHRLSIPPGPGVTDIQPVRPKTPLSEAALLE